MTLRNGSPWLQTELPRKNRSCSNLDVGYLGSYRSYYPVFQSMEFKGCILHILVVDSGRRGYVAWPMIEGGWPRPDSESSSHSASPDLATKSRDGLIWEILGGPEP